MSKIELEELQKIKKSQEIIDLLVEKDIIVEEKFRKEIAYKKELKQLQTELLWLQSYVISNKKRLLIIFEGRDAAGKGGTISRMVNLLNPKHYRVVALPKPTELEQGQWYFQRHFKQLPNAGEVVFFDRSWYNRAVVEPVFGFCSEEQHESFMKQVLDIERVIQEDGIILIKFFLQINKKRQKKRLESRKKDPLKYYKLGALDQQAVEKWDDYTFYIDKMLKDTSTPDSPWIEINANKKKRARLNSLKYTIQHVEGYNPTTEIKDMEKVTIHK